MKVKFEFFELQTFARIELKHLKIYQPPTFLHIVPDFALMHFVSCSHSCSYMQLLHCGINAALRGYIYFLNVNENILLLKTS